MFGIFYDFNAAIALYVFNIIKSALGLSSLTTSSHYGAGAVLYWTFFIYTFLIFFFTLYLAVMSLYQAYLRRKVGLILGIAGAPILIIGFIVDLIANYTIFIVFFLEPPKEILVTTRLSRHIKGNDGWRKSLAGFFCTVLLNPADPTENHCG